MAFFQKPYCKFIFMRKYFIMLPTRQTMKTLGYSFQLFRVNGNLKNCRSISIEQMHEAK